MVSLITCTCISWIMHFPQHFARRCTAWRCSFKNSYRSMYLYMYIWILYTLTGKQHCLAMRKGFHYQWSNDYCNQMFGYICERRMYKFLSSFYFHKFHFLNASSRFIGLMPFTLYKGGRKIILRWLNVNALPVGHLSWLFSLYST